MSVCTHPSERQYAGFTPAPLLESGVAKWVACSKCGKVISDETADYHESLADDGWCNRVSAKYKARRAGIIKKRKENGNALIDLDGKRLGESCRKAGSGRLFVSAASKQMPLVHHVEFEGWPGLSIDIPAQFPIHHNRCTIVAPSGWTYALWWNGGFPYDFLAQALVKVLHEACELFLAAGDVVFYTETRPKEEAA